MSVVQFPVAPYQAPPSGKGPIDAFQQSSSARHAPQNAIVVPRAIGVRSHVKECSHVRNQKDHFPLGSTADMDISKDELVFSYVDKDGCSTVSGNAGETKIFSALNGKPKEAKYAFEGSAMSNFSAGDAVKSAAIGYQKGGFRMVRNTGPKVGRTGDYFVFRDPSSSRGGFVYRTGLTGGKIVPETVPLRMTMKEFSRPITDSVQDLRTWITGITAGQVGQQVAQDPEVKQVGRALRQLFGNGAQRASTAAFCKALALDTQSMRTMLERGALESPDRGDAKDTARDSFRIGAKFFLWVYDQIKTGVIDEDVAWLHVYEKQTEFLQAVNICYINERRRTCIGRSLGISPANGGDLPLDMNATF